MQLRTLEEEVWRLNFQFGNCLITSSTCLVVPWENLHLYWTIYADVYDYSWFDSFILVSRFSCCSKHSTILHKSFVQILVFKVAIIMISSHWHRLRNSSNRFPICIHTTSNAHILVGSQVTTLSSFVWGVVRKLLIALGYWWFALHLTERIFRVSFIIYDVFTVTSFVHIFGNYGNSGWLLYGSTWLDHLRRLLPHTSFNGPKWLKIIQKDTFFLVVSIFIHIPMNNLNILLSHSILWTYQYI